MQRGYVQCAPGGRVWMSLLLRMPQQNVCTSLSLLFSKSIILLNIIYFDDKVLFKRNVRNVPNVALDSHLNFSFQTSIFRRKSINCRSHVAHAFGLVNLTITKIITNIATRTRSSHVPFVKSTWLT